MTGGVERPAWAAGLVSHSSYEYSSLTSSRVSFLQRQSAYKYIDPTTLTFVVGAVTSEEMEQKESVRLIQGDPGRSAVNCSLTRGIKTASPDLDAPNDSRKIAWRHAM